MLFHSALSSLISEAGKLSLNNLQTDGIISHGSYLEPRSAPVLRCTKERGALSFWDEINPLEQSNIAILRFILIKPYVITQFLKTHFYFFWESMVKGASMLCQCILKKKKKTLCTYSCSIHVHLFAIFRTHCCLCVWSPWQLSAGNTDVIPINTNTNIFMLINH
jgi:hypothetical protein